MNVANNKIEMVYFYAFIQFNSELWLWKWTFIALFSEGYLKYFMNEYVLLKTSIC